MLSPRHILFPAGTRGGVTHPPWGSPANGGGSPRPPGFFGGGGPQPTCGEGDEGFVLLERPLLIQKVLGVEGFGVFEEPGVLQRRAQDGVDGAALIRGGGHHGDIWGAPLPPPARQAIINRGY